jgi:hypothetical protein
LNQAITCGKYTFQSGGQTITLAGFFVYHSPPFLDQHLQRPGLFGIRLKPPQMCPMVQQQIEQDVGVIGIVLRAGRKQCRSKLSGRSRMNGVQVQLRIFAEHKHERTARRFHSNGERTFAESRAQCDHP